RGIRAQVLSNHGHDPVAVRQQIQWGEIDTDRMFLYSTACGAFGSDGYLLSQLPIPSTGRALPAVAANRGFLSYNFFHQGAQVRAFVRPSMANRMTLGLWESYTLADPTAALGVYNNGRFIKTVPHPERLHGPDVFYLKP